MATAPALSKEQPSLKISTAMTVGHASVLMALMVAFSRLTGFGRLMVTSHFYGRNAITDAYNAAFNIPDFITILIAGGALATGFVPVFTEYLSRGQEEAARRTFRAMFTLLGVACGVFTVGLFVLTYTPVGVAIARAQAPTQIDLYLRILRILLIGQFFFVLGGMFTGTLNALRLFWYPALQPVIFNLGIIVFGIWRPAVFGTGTNSIQSQAWGALCGAVIGSIIIQVPALRRNGLSLRPLWDLQDTGVRRVVSSLLPIVFGLASGQIVALILPRFLAGALSEGDLSSLDYANRLMQLPLAILASGPAIALFPTLSLLSAEGKLGELRVQLAAALRRTLLLTMLATALLMALRVPIVEILLQHGKFSVTDTAFTAQVLLCYAFGILGMAAQQMLARGYYALQDTRAPIFIGLVSMGVFFVFGGLFGFAFHGGAAGLAIAASLATSVLGGWMLWGLRHKLGGWDAGATIRVLWKGTIAALLAFGAASGTQELLLKAPPGSGIMRTLILLFALGAAAVVGTGVFTVACKLFKIDEIEALAQKLRRRKKA